MTGADDYTSGVQLVGPFQYHAVTVDGWRVPFLTAQPGNGGIVWLTVDDTRVLDIPVADFDRTVEFVADCIAVALGYTAHPSPHRDEEGLPNPNPRSPWRRMRQVAAPHSREAS
jgi:hypothetical protein